MTNLTELMTMFLLIILIAALKNYCHRLYLSKVEKRFDLFFNEKKEYQQVTDDVSDLPFILMFPYFKRNKKLEKNKGDKKLGQIVTGLTILYLFMMITLILIGLF